MKGNTTDTPLFERKYLKRGDIDKIAAAADVSRQTVSNTLTAQQVDSHVGTYIQAFIDKRKEQLEIIISKEID